MPNTTTTSPSEKEQNSLRREEFRKSTLKWIEEHKGRPQPKADPLEDPIGFYEEIMSR